MVSTRFLNLAFACIAGCEKRIIMNVLAVGAHYDDVELACSGSLIKHVHNGDNVTIVVATTSAFTDKNGKEIRSSQVARQEGQEAAKIIGATLIELNYDTFHIQFNENTTLALIKIIEDLKIDCVYSHWTHDIHRDHSNIGKAVMMAARRVPRFLMYRSNYYDTETPFMGNYYIDITDVMEQKIEVIKAHRSELKRVRYAWLNFFIKQNENDGQKTGTHYAECFQVVRYLGTI